MLIIRLARRGRSGSPFYDIVVAEKARAVKKKFVNKLGYFNPVADGGAGELVYNKEEVQKYVNNGAQMSQAVARLLTKDGFKDAGKFVVARASKPKKEVPVVESVSAEATPDKKKPASKKTTKKDA